MSCHDPLTDEQFAALSDVTYDKVSRHPPDCQYEWSRNRLTTAIHANPIDVHQHPILGRLTWAIDPGSVDAVLVVELLDRLEKLTKKVSRWEHRMHEDGIRKANQYNDRVNVHVPGLGLLLLNELEVVEDACTDKVNSMLEDGWRIVAVCPQPDQRRPDYVLGRSKGAA